MNQEFLKQVGETLTKHISDTFKLDGAAISTLTAVGQNSLTQSLKNYVIKNGSGDIEKILLGQMDFKGSALQSFATQQLNKDISEKNVVPAEQLGLISSSSVDLLIHEFKTGFDHSGNSRDLDGICQFLGIDKNLLKLANSPVGKMFGKFFK